MATLETPRHEECGFVGTPSTPGRAAYALRRHSCERNRQLQASRARRQARLQRIDRTPKPCPHTRCRHLHGTPECYRLDRCRCWPCSRANSAVVARRRRLKGYGRWQPFTDAGLVAAHVDELMAAGLGLARIAELSGVARSILWNLMNGRLGRDGLRRPVTRLRTATADRILAVSATEIQLPGEGWVDAAGTRRRLQALACLGWPQVRLAERIGLPAGQVRTLQLGGSRVRLATAQRTAAVFEQLWDRPAPQATPRQRRAAELARALAKRHRWAPALAWDEEFNPIDDPAARPDLGEPESRERPGRRSKLPPAEELLFLLEHGESEEMIARRFGVKLSAVKRALQRDATERATQDEPPAASGAQEAAA